MKKPPCQLNAQLKQCAKFLWNLFNSDNVLFSRICRYPVYNSDTTMGENIRYFMYKYNISYNDWYGNLSNIYVKIDTHVRSITNYNNVCTGSDQGIV